MMPHYDDFEDDPTEDFVETRATHRWENDRDRDLPNSNSNNKRPSPAPRFNPLSLLLMMACMLGGLILGQWAGKRDALAISGVHVLLCGPGQAPACPPEHERYVFALWASGAYSVTKYDQRYGWQARNSSSLVDYVIAWWDPPDDIQAEAIRLREKR